MRIYILVLDGVFDTGLATVLDGLTMANKLAGSTGIYAPVFDITIVGMRSKVNSALGMQVPVKRFDTLRAPDWVIVPALNNATADELVPALARDDVVDAFEALRSWRSEGASIAAACTGTFVLAEAGLLDGCEATTTWWLSPIFRQRYPEVRLNDHRVVVPSAGVVTAGAALSHLDLAMWLIRKCSPDLAAVVAKHLAFDSRLTQSSYAISDHLAHSDPLIERFDRWVREHLDKPISLDTVANELAASKRTLRRRLHEMLGKTPVEYIQDLRVERAVHLLKTSNLSVDRIAERVGYADGVTLRTLLRRRLGRGVRALRA